MSGAAISSTMPRLQVLPQKSVNQRPTMALLSSSFDMMNSFGGCGKRSTITSLPEPWRRASRAALRFLLPKENVDGLQGPGRLLAMDLPMPLPRCEALCSSVRMAPTVALSRGQVLFDRRQEHLEGADIDGFDEVMVESGL